MAISLVSRTRETMQGTKVCRGTLCIVRSAVPTDARISGACGRIVCFKAVARKQIRMVHVARISRSDCLSVYVTCRGGFVHCRSLSIPYIAVPYFTHPTPTGVFVLLLLLLLGYPKGTDTSQQLCHFIARVTRVVHGINAISKGETEFNCVFHGINVFTVATALGKIEIRATHVDDPHLQYVAFN